MDAHVDALAADVITVTERASRKARQLAEKEGHADAALRVRVLAGGCSGFTYELSFTEAPGADDAVISAPGGFRVLIDPASFGGAEHAEDQAIRLENGGIATRVVRYGDNLTAALAG